MGSVELLVIAIGLSMDAFAVAICKGLSIKKMNYKYAIVIASLFGGFQSLMSLAGYLVGKQFEDYIVTVDHWIAFVLLLVIGVNMIKESKDVCDSSKDPFSIKKLILLAIATSIDALAVGVTLAFLRVDIALAVIVIGVVTFLLSFVGVKTGNLFGARFHKKAEVMGGIILIAMGFKIVLEHLYIL